MYFINKIVKGLALALVVFAITLLNTGCSESPVALPDNGRPTSNTSPSRTFAPVAITLSGIGTRHMKASARAVADHAAAIPHVKASIPQVRGSASGLHNPLNDIEMEPVSNGSFTYGARGDGGVRYLYAAFKVRNGPNDTKAYADALENLTFLAVNTDQTIGQTAVYEMRLFNGDSLAGADAEDIARTIIPTGRVIYNGGKITSVKADILQLFTEDEADSVDISGTAVTDVFPYGFVTHSPDITPGSRTLPGNPDRGQYDGIVTFAFKIPLQAQANEDPFQITMMFLPVQDAQTRLTQSLEEQTSGGAAHVVQRANALDAQQVTLLPGAVFNAAIPIRRLCGPVRVAGPENDPTAVLFDPDGIPAVQSLSPDPYGAGGHTILNSISFSASYNKEVNGLAPGTFVIHGSQSGRQFIDGNYSGDGTLTIHSPQGQFFTGERVEATLTTALGSCKPTVARYRVKATGGSGEFDLLGKHPVSSKPVAMAAGDWNGDGKLDLAVVNDNSTDLNILLGNGSGGFTAVQNELSHRHPLAVTAGDWDGDGNLDLAVVSGHLSYYYVTILKNDGSGNFMKSNDLSFAGKLWAITAGDWDGDGDLDLAVTNRYVNDGFTNYYVSILKNDGTGVFIETTTVSVGKNPSAITAGDWDGDGDLDLAVANKSSDNVSILENDGTGVFTAATPVPVGHRPDAIAIGDWDGDGDLDLAVANRNSSDVSILKNNGSGDFTNTGTPISVGTHPSDIIAGDWNADGHLDLVVIDEGSGKSEVSVMKNDGSGRFKIDHRFAPIADPLDIISGDWNGDGSLDLAIGLQNGIKNRVRILKNE